MSYNGEDMIGDDGYGTSWSEERLIFEYEKLRKDYNAFKLENEKLKNIQK